MSGRIAILPYLPAHAQAIEPQVAQRTEPWPGNSVDRLAQLGPAFSAIEEATGRVLGIAGLAENHPRYATAWALLAEGKGGSFVTIARAIRRVLDAADYARIDTLVHNDFASGHVFARRMGFMLEGIKHRLGEDGSDFAVYVRFAEEP